MYIQTAYLASGIVEWDDQFDRIRRAHLQQISPLLQKRDELKRKEDE
jgi:hypothetical protein